MGPMNAPYYDPYDATIDADPYPIWRRLRDEAPLYHNDALDFYALSRFADVHKASLDWQSYSSARGTVLEFIDTTPPEAGIPGTDSMLGAMMIFMDPPRHDELRQLVSRAFTPRRVAALEERTRGLCAEFLDPLVGGPGFDYVEELGAKIPTMVIGALLGVPDADQDQLRRWVDIMMRLEVDTISDEKTDAIAKISEYMEAMVADRRRVPRDDMVSDLLAAEIDARRRHDAPPRPRRGHVVLHVVGVRRQRNHRPAARLGGRAARASPRATGGTGRATGAGAERS